MTQNKLEKAEQLSKEIKHKTEEAKQVAVGCEDYLRKVYAEIDKKSEALSDLLLEQ